MSVVRPTRRSSLFLLGTVVALLTGLLVSTTPAAAAPTAAAARSRLESGQTLAAGAALTSADGRYRLALQTDGNLVLYAPGRTLWNTGTAGATRLVLQPDGNLVLYDATGRALWSTRTTDGRSLVVQDDGNVVLYGGTAATWHASWTSHTPGPQLAPGASISANESMVSADGRYRLTLSAAGGLLLTGPGRTLWTLDTTATSPRLVMQTDGNLVLYGEAGAVWSSRTSAAAGTVATVAAGRLTVSRAGVDLWHSPSPPARLTPGVWLYPGERIVSPSGVYALVLQGDGNLVLYGPGGAS